MVRIKQKQEVEKKEVEAEGMGERVEEMGVAEEEKLLLDARAYLEMKYPF